MEIYKRNNQSTEMFSEEAYGRVQAAFNSDGCITLRYTAMTDDREHIDGERIVVLNREETASIFMLLEKFGGYTKGLDLPY